jgi:transposase
VVQGLVDILHHIGGAPRRLIFDNASGVGRRIGETVRMTDLFQRFAAHYGFDIPCCNPRAGHEKGHVENPVGFKRRHRLVPVPHITDLVRTNRELLAHSETPWPRRHDKKERAVAELFTEERAAFRALPSPAFAPYRYTRIRTDRPGRFCLEGQHWYSSAPA